MNSSQLRAIERLRRAGYIANVSNKVPEGVKVMEVITSNPGTPYESKFSVTTHIRTDLQSRDLVTKFIDERS